ncbi:siroheme synthase CysG [Roseibium marinum]|uniref:Uroporphyrin-III C-methyltransferase/precorrin-2 dehydrogenase/sirohydrochlorin ferrochelatase n=1 Tax=Roseibium marinum TaxID=281252 RepID=A0A2S3UV58_9HYPH|nr:siroheme synthase CysG [Roseibium marinum]POF31601.1 uroporphyrin-III C-methyltransferase/precorrin-2 dehydrogenase/sirohydrochlorin ferrochelatase [Roseibium marinum]
MTPTSRKPVEVESRRRPAHVGALASLPLFFPLQGRKVLLAGGTEAAAWKAELLAAAGAEVHVYAVDLEPSFAALLVSGSAAGRLVHHAKPWTPASFDGAALAIADARSDGEAEAFVHAARQSGVPVNVIDNPPFCDFQFGSIVNRSPVVIGISTNGVAPILGQAIRRRIETLLPQSLQIWAGLAGRVRGRALSFLKAGQERRRFWERFTDLAFSGRDAPEETGELESSLLGEARASGSGRVTLVGAGPGDAEYLTLKAVRALQAADVILFDDLVDDAVLELARREAKRLLVGKRGGRESCRQEDINAMMVRLARQGKHVVRLKSGDPMIFGRGGEELDRLAAEGIAASVVPGITAASAMAARLGISLTHRDHAQSVRFVTGHGRHGDLPDTVDWHGLTDAATTTVFYMGARMAGKISAKLISEGMSPHMPVVAVAAVSRKGERKWVGTLGALAAGVDRLGLEDPVLIGVGSVFRENLSRKEAGAPQTAREDALQMQVAGSL